MFERFTERARRVMVLAQEEVRLLRHTYIGPEHLILGLLHEGEGVAAQVLQEAGVVLETVRARITPGEQDTLPSPPFTKATKDVLANALREALQLGHSFIGTEHILLSLVRDDTCPETWWNLMAPVGRDEIRKRVVQKLTGYGKQAEAAERREAETMESLVRFVVLFWDNYCEADTILGQVTQFNRLHEAIAKLRTKVGR
jgi:ATP-dependent Clp protease ATP-binding subunit ClpC